MIVEVLFLLVALKLPYSSESHSEGSNSLWEIQRSSTVETKNTFVHRAKHKRSIPQKQDNTIPYQKRPLSASVTENLKDFTTDQADLYDYNSIQSRPKITDRTNTNNQSSGSNFLNGTRPKKIRVKDRGRNGRARHGRHNDISLWIDERQVRLFSGYPMEIYAIVDGRVMPYILEPDFEDQLPIIPSEVHTVNFTWKSGGKRYFYDFNVMTSFNTDILHHPYLSIRRKGRVPRKPKAFSIHIPCVGSAAGVAVFEIELAIQNRKGDLLSDMPLRLRLRKQCELMGSADPSCDEKCGNGGICDDGKRCICPEGYMGQFCNTSLCYPQCKNGGICSRPGVCSCPRGYVGRYCEGGLCIRKCLNGGKCIQKDTCACQRGFYGNRCEFSKCVIPCVNGGKCKGVNKCRCKTGYSGDHCEVITTGGLARLLSRCESKCRHGICTSHGHCQCEDAYMGRWCRRKFKRRKQKSYVRRKLWV